MDMDEEMKDAPKAAPAPPPVFKAPKQVSRPKPAVQQEEELGADPKLGDFDSVQPLSVSEARAVIQAVYEARKNRDPRSNPLGADRVHNDSATITSFVEYMEHFSRYKQTENLHAMAAVFDNHPELTTVERAMLGSLCCDSSEEAKTLIPSLATKMDDDTLQPILDELQKMQDRLL